LFDAANRAFQEMLLADPENLTTQFQLAQVEIRRGEMYASLAGKPGSPAVQSQYWKKALASLAPGVARMRKVNEKSPLSGTEKVVLDVGVTTLARGEAALAPRVL
jgi:hypothetical protein